MTARRRQVVPAGPPARRGDRTLTVDEQCVQDAWWPGFNMGATGQQDPDLLAGAVMRWRERGSPRHDDGTVCPCPLGAAWPCTCPTSCSRCERLTGCEPLGPNRYADA